MSVLSHIRTDRLVRRFLSEANANSPVANQIIGKLRRDPASATQALFDRLDQASEAEFKNIAVGLYKLLNDETLEYYFDALRSGKARRIRVVARILGTSGHFDPNRLLPLFEDPDVPKSTLIKSLSEHPKRLNPELMLRHASQLEPADHGALFTVIDSISDDSLIPSLLNRLSAADASIRAHVTRSLARFPSRQVARALEQCLADDSRLVRMAAIEGLANSGLRPTIDSIAPLLRDPDLRIQSHAIDALIKLKHPQTMSYLVPILQDESEYVRRAGVEVLNEIADVSLVSNLLAVLRDKDWWVRERAADALSRVGGPRVIESMLELITSEDEYVRRTAIEVINASRDPRAYDHLVAALADEDWWVKERAVDALAGLGAASAIPSLLQVLERDPHARPTVLRALAALADSSLVPHLHKHLLDEDPQVRLEALRTLESLTDEACAQAVISSIESAMEQGSEQFRDQARGVMRNIRARFSSADAGESSGSAPTEISTTMIARPGEPPQRLQPGTRLDLAALTPGTVLDNRYRFVERVGHGAFGTVMRFEDTTVGEEVILKFLNEQVSDNQATAKRFVKELRYARRVTHPNVIRIYDFQRIGGLYAISMEYFAGFPLTSELLQDAPMRTDRALRVLREITFGMHAAHRSGVVHRDLKPANILMSHFDQVKVVDFGIAAAAFRDSEDETSITQTGDFVGTPAFTSPEQVLGQTVDARTDIYSLGIVMYRMFGGRLPYQDKDRRKLLLRHLEGRPRPLTELNRELPAGLAEVVMRAMAIKPKDRHPSMTALRQELERFMS